MFILSDIDFCILLPKEELSAISPTQLFNDVARTMDMTKAKRVAKVLEKPLIYPVAIEPKNDAINIKSKIISESFRKRINFYISTRTTSSEVVRTNTHFFVPIKIESLISKATSVDFMSFPLLFTISSCLSSRKTAVLLHMSAS